MPSADKPKAPSPDPSGDGVRIHPHDAGRARAWAYMALAVVLVAICILSLVRVWRPSPPHQSRSATDAASAGPAGTDGSSTDGAARVAATPTNATRLAAPDDISNYIPPGEAPPMAEVIARLNKAGVHTGLGAFQPPGTSPPLVGLAVPEDFDLPEGYVRHYQATDDGQRIEPILMFSPDFDFRDAAGRPVRLPPDRVVPPEMAPPGLPIRLIRIPPPLQPKGGSA